MTTLELASPAVDEQPASPMRRTARIGGTVTALIGGAGMIAWQFRLTGFLRLRATDTPMRFNTALCLAVIGVAIVARTFGRSRPLRAAGALATLLGGATLLQNWLGWNLHFNDLLMRDYLAPTTAPVQLSSNTAICFLAAGTAVLLWRPLSHAWRAKTLMVASIVVAGVAAAAIFGDLARPPARYQWSLFVLMPMPTAYAMCMLATSLMALGIGNGRTGRTTSTSWIVLPVGLGVFAMVGLLWQTLVASGTDVEVVSADAASRAVLLLSALAGASAALIGRSALRASVKRYEARILDAKLREEVVSRSQAEAVAREDEKLLFRFLDALPVGVFIAKPGPQPYFMNDAATKLFGRGIERLGSAAELSERYGLYVAGTDQLYPLDRSPLLRCLTGESVHEDDIEVRLPTGSTLVEEWGTALCDEEGEVLFSIAAFVDISQRRSAERQSAEKTTLLDLSQDAIYIGDTERRITYWNRGAQLKYGWSSDEALGQNSLELLGTELPEPIEVVKDQLRQSGHWRGEIVNRDRSGNQHAVISQWATTCDASGERSAVMVIDSDVTALKAAERELRLRGIELEQLNLDLNRSNEDLEQFAYAASHDLAEPLRAISGPISLLARRYQGQLDDKADEYIEFAVDGCERMQTLINGLLTFSRVGRMDAAMDLVDVDGLIAEVLADLHESIEARSAVITVSEMPKLYCSPSETRQVFQNLVANAIKFTAADNVPHVQIDAERIGEAWRFTVSDNGIGIEDRHRERIFGMFKRLHGRDEYPGTGIGLALAKKIVQRHGGDIGITDSAHGTGSTFWFTAPAEQKESS